MKKLLLFIVCAFLLVFSLLYLFRQKSSASKVTKTRNYNKKIDNIQLNPQAVLNTRASSYRFYMYDDSLYLITEDQKIIATDSGLHGISVQPIPFKLGNNSIWYFGKQGTTTSYLTYPAGNLIQVTAGRVDSFLQGKPVFNCVNTGNIFWGQTTDRTYTRRYMSVLDITQKTEKPLFDFNEECKKEEGYSPECFTTSIDGNFVQIGDSSFLFYNYYSSYLLHFRNNKFTPYSGIDSLRLRKYKKVKTTVGDYQIEKCMADNENFIHLSGASDGKFVYLLSNYSTKELKGQRLIDVYDAMNMQYLRSILLPDRDGAKPLDVTTASSVNSLYVLYTNNELVKYPKL